MESFSIFILLFFVLLGLFFHKSKIAEYGLLILLFILFAFEKSIGDYEGYLLMYDEIASGVGRANEYEFLYVFACSTAAKMGLTFDQMRYIFCVADVCGKGYSAAVLTVVLSVFMSHFKSADELTAQVTNLN